ncbi:hypothetical protein [Rhodocyclus tenuis]|uniref:Uncharacterized protein n=1 Tax=Rhodocyclus tenuis TaxID=1066 RepID=A0A840GHG8_RHOTE|nr:hypothetical protein [Rhodocyclus tenuis]MBB4247629.1 hypothetical protein [Rhodocyclus tenuis]
MAFLEWQNRKIGAERMRVSHHRPRPALRSLSRQSARVKPVAVTTAKDLQTAIGLGWPPLLREAVFKHKSPAADSAGAAAGPSTVPDGSCARLGAKLHFRGCFAALRAHANALARAGKPRRTGFTGNRQGPRRLTS